ncbi:MAG: hypothetical protein V4521_17445 [Pseudomonadota bacterium]
MHEYNEMKPLCHAYGQLKTPSCPGAMLQARFGSTQGDEIIPDVSSALISAAIQLRASASIVVPPTGNVGAVANVQPFE